MAEVLLQFDRPLMDEDGVTYVARVCGGIGGDGLWTGWIEFDPQNGGSTLRTPRETTQPNRADLEYWATGLTFAYLEGALARACNPATPDLRPRSVAADAADDQTGSSTASATEVTDAPRPRPRTILDPFAVYAQGEEILREELSALDEGHLRNIIRAHDLVDEGEMDLSVMSRSTLAEIIIAAVRRR